MQNQIILQGQARLDANNFIDNSTQIDNSLNLLIKKVSVFNKTISGVGTGSTNVMKNFGALTSLKALIGDLKNTLATALENSLMLFRRTLIAVGALSAGFLAMAYSVKTFASDIILSTEKMKGYNIALLALMKTQTGVNSLMSTALKVSNDLPIAYDQVFSSIRAYAMIGPLRPMLQDTKNLEGNLKEINGIVMALSQIEPEWGIQGAIFSLREALSGDLLSLKRRFEIPVNLITTMDGKKLTDVKNDPNKVIHALSSYFGGIFGKEALEQTSRQFGSLLAKFQGFYEQFKNKIGTAGIYDAVVNDLVAVRDALSEFVNSISADKIARNMSDSLVSMYNATKEGIRRVSIELAKMFDLNVNFNSIESTVSGLSDALDYYAYHFVLMEKIVTDEEVWKKLNSYIKTTTNYFWMLVDVIKEVAGNVISHFNAITEYSQSSIDKITGLMGGTNKGTVATGIFYLWLFGPTNVAILAQSTLNTFIAGFRTLDALTAGILAKTMIWATAFTALEMLVKKVMKVFGEKMDFPDLTSAIVGPMKRLPGYVEEILKEIWYQINRWYLVIKTLFQRAMTEFNDYVGDWNAPGIQPMKSLFKMLIPGKDELRKQMNEVQLMDFASDSINKDIKSGLKDEYWNALKTNITNKLATISGFVNEIWMADVGGVQNTMLGKLLGESTKMFQTVSTTADNAANSVKNFSDSYDYSNFKLEGKLAGLEEKYKQAGKKYNIDPRFLGAISMFETGRGTNSGVKEKFNVGGIMDPKKNWEEQMVFSSYDESIEYMAKIIKRMRDSGQQTLEQIAWGVPDKSGVLKGGYSPIGAKNDKKGTNKDWVNGVAMYFNQLINDKTEQINISVDSGGKLAADALMKRAGKAARDFMTKSQPDILGNLKGDLSGYEADYRNASSNFTEAMRKVDVRLGSTIKTEYEKTLEQLTQSKDGDQFVIGNDLIQEIEKARDTALSTLEIKYGNLASTKAQMVLERGKRGGSSNISILGNLMGEAVKMYLTSNMEADRQRINEVSEQRIKDSEEITKNFWKKQITEDQAKMFGLNVTALKDSGQYKVKLARDFSENFPSVAKELGYNSKETNQFQIALKEILVQITNFQVPFQEAVDNVVAKNKDFLMSFEETTSGIFKNFDWLGSFFNGNFSGIMKTAGNLFERGINWLGMKTNASDFGETISKLLPEYLKFAKTNENISKYMMEQAGYAEKIKNLDFTKVKEMDLLFAQMGSMNRANKGALFTAVEGTLEQNPRNATESLILGMMSAASQFKNMSEEMINTGKELVGNLQSTFESGFFDFMKSKITNLSDMFKSMGASIRDTILKIIAKMVALSATKLVLGIDVNASGGFSMGGVSKGILGSFLGGQGASGGMLGGIGKLLGLGGSGEGGTKDAVTALATSKASSMTNKAVAALSGKKILSGGGTLGKIGQFLKTPAGMGVMAAGLFLSQPGRLFGGSIDHTETEKGIYSNQVEWLRGMQGRQSEDSANYIASGRANQIQGFQFKGPKYWDSSSGNGIWSKQTTSGNVDYKEFTASMKQYYGLLYTSAMEHYGKLRDIDRVREVSESQALTLEKQYKMEYLNVISGNYNELANKASSQDDFKKLDDLRNKIAEGLDEQIKLQKQIIDAAREEMLKKREYDAFTMFGLGKNDVAYQEQLLANEKVRVDALKGTFAWYDANMSYLKNAKDLADSIKENVKKVNDEWLQTTASVIQTSGYVSTELTQQVTQQLKGYYSDIAMAARGEKILGFASNEEGVKAREKQIKDTTNYYTMGSIAGEVQYNLDNFGATSSEQMFSGIQKAQDIYLALGRLATESGDTDLMVDATKAYADFRNQEIEALTSLQSFINTGYVSSSVMDIQKLISGTVDDFRMSFESIQSTVRSSNFKNNIFATIKDFETTGQFTDIVSQMKQLEPNSQIFNELSSVQSSLSSTNDPFQSWYNWAVGVAQQKINNAKSGSDEYYDAQKELFDLMVERSNKLKQKANDATKKMEESLDAIAETLKMRMAEERKTTKGDIFYLDVTKTPGITPQDIESLRTAIKNGDPSAANLLETMKQKMMGISK